MTFSHFFIYLLFLASTELLWPLLALLASEWAIMPPPPTPLPPMLLSQLLLSSAAAAESFFTFGSELPLTIFCLLDGGGGGVLPLLSEKK